MPHLDTKQRAELALIMARQLRDTLTDVASRIVDDQDRLEVESAVVAILLKEMFLRRGQPWLEAVMAMCLTPIGNVVQMPAPAPEVTNLLKFPE